MQFLHLVPGRQQSESHKEQRQSGLYKFQFSIKAGLPLAFIPIPVPGIDLRFLVC